VIGEVIVWPSFTSASIDRNLVISRFIDGEDSLLFEILPHPGDVAVAIHDYSDHPEELEILIAASSGFMMDRVEWIDVHGYRIAQVRLDIACPGTISVLTIHHHQFLSRLITRSHQFAFIFPTASHNCLFSLTVTSAVAAVFPPQFRSTFPFDKNWSRSEKKLEGYPDRSTAAQTQKGVSMVGLRNGQCLWDGNKSSKT
jgi:hypothetical protein